MKKVSFGGYALGATVSGWGSTTAAGAVGIGGGPRRPCWGAGLGVVFISRLGRRLADTWAVLLVFHPDSWSSLGH